ncbi:hypothetical protein [Roseibium sp.]|uniref:hypothetical protein n=1 Tax=Roseibium sp. TaxID=1936156 RepID=UPI003A96BCC3
MATDIIVIGGFFLVPIFTYAAVNLLSVTSEAGFLSDFFLVETSRNTDLKKLDPVYSNVYLVSSIFCHVLIILYVLVGILFYLKMRFLDFLDLNINIHMFYGSIYCLLIFAIIYYVLFAMNIYLSEIDYYGFAVIFIGYKFSFLVSAFVPLGSFLLLQPLVLLLKFIGLRGE